MNPRGCSRADARRRRASCLLAAALALCLLTAGTSFAGADFLTPFTGGIAPFSGTSGGTWGTQGWGSVRAGVVSHHGLASAMIARFYDALPADVERVILIGPDHFRAGRAAVTLCPLPWKVGGTTLEIDGPAAGTLSRARCVGVESLPFRTEHSIGLHIAFTSRWFPKAKVSSLIVRNDCDPRALQPLVPLLSDLMRREKTVMILSMDFSHGKMPDEARREDDKTVETILNFDTASLPERDIDASRGAWLFLEVLKNLGFTDGTVLERTDSAAIVGRADLPCTSYAVIAFQGQAWMTSETLPRWTLN